MAVHIAEELKRLQSLQLSSAEVLEAYKHIPLAEEDLLEALIWAKRKKEHKLQEEALRQKEEYNRKIAKSKMDFDVIRTFMFNRAKEIFKYDFVIDDENTDCFDLLCYYFTENQEGFERLANVMGVSNPSLDKGLLICGNPGTGKTDMMKLFQKNTRQVYYMRPAKKVCADFLKSSDKLIPEEYTDLYQLSVNDPATLYQKVAGICIDDMGAESEKNNYGNHTNVIGELIEIRYDSGFMGPLMHGTTNLSAEELTAFYGERVVSRMRQKFNFIELGEKDRRR